MSEVYVIVAILIVAGALAFLMWLLTRLGIGGIELPEKRAGRMGEHIANAVISEILQEDDLLFSNVEIMADGKQTELDNVIINSNGVFIIEVKNFSGELFGSEDDYEWIKTKMTYGGFFYQKSVKNPIKQVKRQIYILSQFLKKNGINVWVNGYVFFVQGNAPFESPFILMTQHDINITIHGESGNTLSDVEKERIRELFYYG